MQEDSILEDNDKDVEMESPKMSYATKTENIEINIDGEQYTDCEKREDSVMGNESDGPMGSVKSRLL